MATGQGKRFYAYGVGESQYNIFPSPIIAQRKPTTLDRAEIGSTWIDQPNDDAYILTKVAANVSTWINTGGGSGTFSSITTTGTATIGTSLTTGTTATIGTDLTVSGLTAGVVQSSAVGLFSSTPGTNGQLLIGSTAAAAVFGAITSATLVITPGAGTLNIEESGGTANSFVTDVGGPIVPLLGVTDVLGGTNITTDGSVANTITIDLDPDVTLAGFLQAGTGLINLAGDVALVGSSNAPQTIYLHGNGGTLETVDIHSDQGTGQNSVYVHSDLGGVLLEGGLASGDALNFNTTNAAGGMDFDAGTSGFIFDTTGSISLDSATASNMTVTGAFDLSLQSTLGSVNIEGGEAAVDAILIDATDVAGGISLTCGSGGLSLSATNGVISVLSGTAAINVGTDATSKIVTIGGTNTTCQTIVQSGSGDLILTSTDAITSDSAGSTYINSSAGDIYVGDDNIAQTVEINTGAAAKVTTIGSTDTTSSTTVQAGTSNLIMTSGDAITLDSVGNTEINTSAGNISIANDAVATVLTLGNITGATSVVVDCGTNGVSVGASATNHTSTFGSVSGTSSSILQSGTGNTLITSTDTIELDAAGNLELNSSAGNIQIANDAVAQNINIATGGAAQVLTLGNVTTTSQVVVDCGTSGASFAASATNHTTTIGSTSGTSDTILQAGSTGLKLQPTAGNVSMVPVTGSVAAAAITIDAKLGSATFTGITTASGAQETFTITNSEISATSAVFVTVTNVGSNDCRLTLEQVKPAAGSVEIMTQNNGGANANGNIIINFWVFA